LGLSGYRRGQGRAFVEVLNLEASEVLVLTNRPESERLVLADE
jgi:hypothetical protein